MRESGRDSNLQAGRGRILKQDEGVTLWHGGAATGWSRAVTDSLLALVAVGLVTAFIGTSHLYPRLPSLILIYLLTIIALASTRGRYAAILAALLASLFFDFFFTPPLYVFSFTDLGADDLLDPWVFLVTGLIAGQLTVALRRHAEEARHREHEALLLSQQAQELASLKERQHLARELHDSVSQALYGISLGAHTAREALLSNPDEATAPLDYVIALAGASLDEMRALIFPRDAQRVA